MMMPKDSEDNAGAALSSTEFQIMGAAHVTETAA